MSEIPIGIAVAGEGAHPAAWRFATQIPERLLTPDRIRERFRQLDGSSLSFATISQRYGSELGVGVAGELDSIETTIFAAAVTKRILLVAESNAIHSEPFHIANQLNTLDWSAKGRSGWLVRSDNSAAVAFAYGKPAGTGREASDRETREVIDSVRRLWDTWEDEIFLADEANHRFLDLERWHYADFEGEFFNIKGPGLLPRPPQGQLPVWSKNLSETVAPLIDIALVSGGSIAEVADAAQLAIAAGASRTVAEVEIVLDANGVTGTERLQQLDQATVWQEDNRLRLVGSAATVAEYLVELRGIVDGIQLHPAVIDIDVPVIISTLLPALAQAGVFSSSAATLRELFALETPINIFSIIKEQL